MIFIQLRQERVRNTFLRKYLKYFFLSNTIIILVRCLRYKMEFKQKTFQLQTLSMRRDSIIIMLQQAIEFYQKELYSQTQKLIQQISSINLSPEETLKIIPLLSHNIKSAWGLVVWVISHINYLSYSKWIFKTALLIIVLSQQQPVIENSYIFSPKHLQMRLPQLQQKLTSQITDFQLFLIEMKDKCSLEQLRQIFRQVGQVLFLTNDKRLQTRCYYFYYQLDLSNESKFLLGNTLVKAGEIKKGINYIKQIDYSNYSLQGLAIIAKLHHQAGDIKQSVETYLKIFETDCISSYFSILSHFQLGKIYQKLLFYRHSIQRFKKSIEINQLRNEQEKNLYWRAILKIASMYCYNKQQTYSISILEKVIDREDIPFVYQLKALKLLGDNLISINNFSKALYYYHKIQTLKPSSANLLDVCYAYIYLENYEQSKKYLQKLLEYEDYRCIALINFAFVYIKVGQIKQAQLSLSKAEKIDKNKTVTHKFYSQILQEIYGKNDISKIILKEAKSQFDVLSLKYEQKGVQCRQKFLCNESLYYLAQSLKYTSQFRPSLLFELGANLFISQRFTQSLIYFHKVIELDSTNLKALQLMFVIYDNLKKKQERNACLNKIENLNYQLAQRLFKSVKQTTQNQLIQKEKRIVDGIDLSLLPSNSVKNQGYLQNLNYSLTLHLMRKKNKAFEIIANIFKTVFDEPQKLFKCAVYLAEENYLEFSGLFCKRYFAIMPFDKQGLKRYISIIRSKQKRQENDVNHIQFCATYADKDGQYYYELAQIFKKMRLFKPAILNAIAAFDREGTEEYYYQAEKLVMKFDYNYEQALLKICILLKNKHWRIHEKLAKFYRRKNKLDEEVHHLQQVMNLSWNKQKILMRLCEIYKKSSIERYFLYGKQLAEIQTKNKDLLVELTQVFESHFKLLNASIRHSELLQCES